LVFKFGTKKPKSLSWKEIDRVVVKLGAVYIGTKGDHRKYHRAADDITYVIVFPQYKDCYRDIIDNVIRMCGVSGKEFWAVYNGAKYVIGEGVKITK
jgi:predicted RNA binding protein YcfA (HicA-like mRNA interferase family)